MFDARSILDQLVGSGMMNNGRMGHALGPDGLRQRGGGLGDLLGSVLGGTGTSGSSGRTGGLGGMGGSGGLGGLAGKAQDMLGQGSDAVRSNNPLAVGGLGALAGAVLGGGTRGALGGGVLALLGSIAYSALSKQQGATPAADALGREAPLGLREPQNQAEAERLNNNALLVLRAMVNAAKADGTVDAEEVRKIAGHLQQTGADTEAQQFVMAEIAKPMDTDGIVSAADSPELAVEVYAASLLAIDVDTDAERRYIKDLAQRLGLGREALDEIHRALGVQDVAI